MKAKNYSEYQAESDKYFKETLAELKIAENTPEHKLFEKYKSGVDENNRLLMSGDAYSRHLSQQFLIGFNDDYNRTMEQFRHGSPADKAAAATAEEAIGKFGSKMRGPNIIERGLVEPYYSKEDGVNVKGIASLIGGLGLGFLVAKAFGGSFFQSLGLMAIMGLSAGVVMPTAFSWLTDKFNGKKPESENEPSREQEVVRGRERSQETLVGFSGPEQRRSIEHLPEDVMRDARQHGRAIQPHQQPRGNITTFGGAHYGMPNIPYAGSSPVQYGNRWNSPTAIGPSFVPSPAYYNLPAVATSGAAVNSFNTMPLYNYGGLNGLGGNNGYGNAYGGGYGGGLGYGGAPGYTGSGGFVGNSFYNAPAGLGAYNSGIGNGSNGYSQNYGYNLSAPNGNGGVSPYGYGTAAATYRPIDGGYGGYGGGYGGYGGGRGLDNGGYGLNTNVANGPPGRIPGVVYDNQGRSQLPNIPGLTLGVLPNFPGPGSPDYTASSVPYARQNNLINVR